MRAIRKATEQDRYRILKGIDLLKRARDLMREAGAKRSVDKIRSAIKSSGGALRHIDHAIRREQTRAQREAGITDQDLDQYQAILDKQRSERERGINDQKV